MMKRFFSILVLSGLIMTGCQEKTDESKIVLENQNIVSEQVQNIANEPSDDNNKMITEQNTDMNIVDDNLAVTIPTIMFHYIEDISADDPDQMRYNLSYSPDNLEELLIYCRDNNIETLTFGDVKDLVNGQKKMPNKAVILTFDDGYTCHYENAYPLLKKYGMKGVFYIIASKPGNDSAYATWDQIKEMSDNGMEIGSHTVNHLDLASLSDDQIDEELAESQKIISEKIGRPVISLCYPAGKYSEQVMNIAEQYYLFARTTQPGDSFILADRYEIPTNRIFPTTGVGLLQVLFEE